MNTVTERFITAVKEDLKSIRQELDAEDSTTIYHRILPSNPKPYPISGLQHFFGTAFIALRLTEFLNLDEEKQITAFLAGLLHDYEKIGLKREELMKSMNLIIGEETKLYAELRGYENLWNDAIEVASNLESGGLRRELQKIAELVRLGDYLTGGEDSWNISYAMDLVKASLDRLGVEYHLIPIVIGRQRPVVALVAEKLEEEIEKSGMVPLLSTPTGLVVLSRTPVSSVKVDDLYRSLTQHVISTSSTVAVSSQTTEKSSTINLSIVETIIELIRNLRNMKDDQNNSRKNKLKKEIPNKLKEVKPLYALSVIDLEKAKRSAETPEDKRRLVIYLAISFAKTLYGKINDKTLKKALNSLGIDVKEDTYTGMILQLYEDLSKPVDWTNRLLEFMYDKAVEHILNLTKGKNIEESVTSILKRTIGVGFVQSFPSSDGDTVCSTCRERFRKDIGRTLYEQLRIEERIKKISYTDVFHPDKQGKPESASSMDGSSKKMYVCPVCFFEAKVLADVVKFADGSWTSNIIYYPAVSVDLLKVIKDVASNYVVAGYRKTKKKVETLVIPDYISSRIIIKTSDEQGRLGKNDLRTALDLWYLIGGNLILTTNALSIPPPWSGLPIEMEVGDAIIEESINMFVKELRIAREKGEWWRARQLRKILYEQLRAYVLSLEEVERRRGRTKFMKHDLIVTGYPALDVYSSLVLKHM